MSSMIHNPTRRRAAPAIETSHLELEKSGPKCRIVAFGSLDPDLKTISRNAATPGIAEHLLYSMLVAGYNSELFCNKPSGDAATAFLQGQQSERALP